MFDIGWPEIVVILIVAIVVIGPRDLPKAFYTVGKWVRAARRVTSDFQRHVDDMVRETELEDLKKVANQARGLNVKNQIEKAIDPTGGITSDFKSALAVDDVTDGKSATPASTGKPSSAAPASSIATPSISKPAAEAETKAEAATPVKKAAARKPSPRVASRVPKRTAKTAAAPKAPPAKAASVTSSKAAAKPAAKAPNPEKTS